MFFWVSQVAKNSKKNGKERNVLNGKERGTQPCKQLKCGRKDACYALPILIFAGGIFFNLKKKVWKILVRGNRAFFVCIKYSKYYGAKIRNQTRAQCSQVWFLCKYSDQFWDSAHKRSALYIHWAWTCVYSYGIHLSFIQIKLHFCSS